MSQWEVEFAGAVANLETAYAVDQRAYDALRDPLKASWALLPTWMWPEPERVGALLRARIDLVAAEDDVRDLVRRQSIAIRHARARRQAMVQRRAFAQTTPDELSGPAALAALVRPGIIANEQPLRPPV
ncbi:hypothetical protein ACSFA0_12465 [Variovorax sp. LT1P1]|uniref:hypothetical protein n=1 Tax=Variovorax sp. LT1P1 TaxID=3443730 RepID=UPI003F4476AF